jgi:formiminotetrahydrofolate cyclodeaminase
MAHTAMWGAIYNVRINLGSIKDRTFISEMRQQIEAVLQKADIEMANLLQEVDRKIGA